METTGSYNESTITGDPTLLNEETASTNGATAPTNGATAPTAVAGVFADRESAHNAAHRLHDEGFRDTWIGITKSEGGGSDYFATSASSSQTNGETRIESENWFTRFFGEGDESLHDALVRHGVSEADASAAGTLPAHSALLTVDGANHPELAAQIISQTGGQVITRGFGATGYGTAGAYAAGRDLSAVSEAPASRTTSLYDEGVETPDTEGRATGRPSAATDDIVSTRADLAAGAADPRPSGSANEAAVDAGDRVREATAYDDYGHYRAGTPIDESTRIQLREERLRVDKSRISRGEATVGTEVVTETQNFDVPLVREELFIQRRPVSGSPAESTNGSPIGEGEVVHVPLSEEKVSVTKVPVVTEEVVVGKRQVEDTQHISETTRKEQLNVADVAVGGTSSGTDGR